MTPSKNRDPDCRSGFFVISYGNPRDLRQVGDFVDLPAGHTASCINDCDYVWTGGPARRNDLAYLGPIDAHRPGAATAGRSGSPTCATPRKPKVFGNPIDLWRNDGATDYSHDVQVDERGIAWVSGRGGIRGYATQGHPPRPAPPTCCARPRRGIRSSWPAAASAGSTSRDDVHAQLVAADGRLREGHGVERGNILIGTEEEFNDDCESDGRLVVSDLTDSWGGEPALNSTRRRRTG